MNQAQRHCLLGQTIETHFQDMDTFPHYLIGLHVINGNDVGNKSITGGVHAHVERLLFHYSKTYFSNNVL